MFTENVKRSKVSDIGCWNRFPWVKKLFPSALTRLGTLNSTHRNERHAVMTRRGEGPFGMPNKSSTWAKAVTLWGPWGVLSWCTVPPRNACLEYKSLFSASKLRCVRFSTVSPPSLPTSSLRVLLFLSIPDDDRRLRDFPRTACNQLSCVRICLMGSNSNKSK